MFAFHVVSASLTKESVYTT